MKGKQPENLRNDGKTCAEKMSYHWAENTDPALPYDGLMYDEAVIVAVRLKKIRYTIDWGCIIERELPEDVEAIRALPLPPYVRHELWIRTQNEREFRRFYILPKTTAELEANTREGYRSTHYREDYWKKAPNQIDVTLHREVKEDSSRKTL
jgi:hypothetical protein